MTCFPVSVSTDFSGTTTGDAKSIVACGGGAIKIYAEKNLTISK